MASGDERALAPTGLTSRLGLNRRKNDMADAANQIANRVPTNLVVNGVRRTLDLVPWTTLLDALRDHLALTGKKRAAITVNAAPVPCWSMAGGSIPV